MLLIGFVSLFICNNYLEDEFLDSLMTTFGISIISSGIFSFIMSSLQIKSIEQIIEESLTVVGDCNKQGLVSISDFWPFDNEAFKRDFIESKHVIILMNDGKRFLNNEKTYDALTKRLKQKAFTDFILLDYDQQDTIDCLTRKNGHSDNATYYHDKIKNVIEHEIRINLGNKKYKDHKISVYLNPNYNTLAIVLTDNYAAYSIFRVSPGQDTVPHFLFNANGTEYKRINDDVKNIISSAKKINI